MSKLVRWNDRCEVCHNTFKGRPIEVLVHGGRGGSVYWRYSTRHLCFVCKQAQLDFWFPPDKNTRPIVAPHQLPARHLTADDLEDLLELAQWEAPPSS